MGMMLDEARPDWLNINDGLYREIDTTSMDHFRAAYLPVAIIVTNNGVETRYKTKKAAAEELHVKMDKFNYHLDNGKPIRKNVFIRRAAL